MQVRAMLRYVSLSGPYAVIIAQMRCMVLYGLSMM